MTDWPDLLTRTYAAVRVPVSMLDEPVLDRATPCSQWSVAAVFEHLVAAIDMFATAAGAPPAAPTGETALARYDAAVERSLTTWSAFTDHGTTLQLPFGAFPSELVVGMNQMDSLVHGWDLAAALGLPTTIPAELAERALQTAQMSVPPSRGHAFGPEVGIDSEDLGARLIAFTGRDPSAWPGAIWVAGSLVTVKPTTGDGSVASAVEIWEREGSGPPKHVHAEHHEIWYVLSGQFRFAIGNEEVVAGTGDVVVGPRGVPHTFRAESPDARLIDIHSPGGVEQFFVQAGRPARSLVPPEPEHVEGPQQLRSRIESFGVQVVGPPIGR